MDEMENAVKPAVPEEPKKSGKKTALKIVLLVLFFSATFYCVYAVSKVLSGGSIASLNKVFSLLKTEYLIALIAVVIGLFFSDALKYAIITKIISGRFDFAFNVNVGLMGRFYDNITPFNTGGQVYQVYQYYKKGYKPDVSTAIPIIKYIFQLISWIIVSFFLYILNSDALSYLPPEQSSVVGIVCYIGIAVACCAPALTILFSIFPNTIRRVIGFFINIGHKLKFVKDPEKADSKVLDFLTQYRESFLKINKNVIGIIALFIVSALDFLLVMSVPYIVLLAFGGITGSPALYVDVITLNAYSLFAASLVPTPGNSGAIEAVYSMVFAPIPMGEGMLFWIVFIWRFCTYYIYLILGLGETIAIAIYRAATRKRRLAPDMNREYRRECGEQKKENVKVLEVVDNYYPIIDGVVNVVDNYARNLNKKIDCDALVPRYPHSYDKGGYKVIRSLSMSGGKFGVRLPLPMLDPKLRKHFKENRYDLIHCHSPVTLAKYVLKIAKKQNIPVLFTLHSHFHEEINRSVKIRCLQKFALNFLLSTIKKMDYVWAVSEGSRRTLKELYHVDLPCEVMINGTDSYPIDRGKLEDLKKDIMLEHGVKPDETVLLFVGRLVVVKNISLVLKTLRLLLDRGEKARLILVGDGDNRKALEKECVSLGVKDNVTFTGSIEDRDRLSAYYACADFFTLPSTFDTYSLSLHEAAAMGLPPIAVKGSCAAEGVVDGHNGYLAEIDASLWADRIQAALQDKEQYANVKINCSTELCRSWKEVTDEALEKYKEMVVLGKRKK